MVNIGALLLACVYSYQARNISTEYAESKYIGIAIFGMSEVFIVGAPLTTLVWENPRARFFLLSALNVTISLSVLLLVFVPKFVLHRKQIAASARRGAACWGRPWVSAASPATKPSSMRELLRFFGNGIDENDDPIQQEPDPDIFPSTRTSSVLYRYSSSTTAGLRILATQHEA